MNVFCFCITRRRVLAVDYTYQNRIYNSSTSINSTQYLQPYWIIEKNFSHDSRLVLIGYALQRLHAACQGMERIQGRAHLAVFWPGACHVCQQARSSLLKEIMGSDPFPVCPFQDVSADIFLCCGNKVMVYVVRFSGWPIVCLFENNQPNIS